MQGEPATWGIDQRNPPKPAKDKDKEKGPNAGFAYKEEAQEELVERQGAEFHFYKPLQIKPWMANLAHLRTQLIRISIVAERASGGSGADGEEAPSSAHGVHGGWI